MFPTLSLQQADRATLDVVKELKAAERGWWQGIVREEFAARAADWQARQGSAAETLDQVGALMASAPRYQIDRALARLSQEMMYGRISEALDDQRSALLDFLESPIANPIGSLRLNAELPLPPYYAVDYHLQPGGMDRDEIIGFITQLSNDVYWGGQNDGLALFRQAVAESPAGPWRRILDMGCGSKSVFAWKEAYPNAEVYGIDLSAPFLRYSHKLAEARGVAIHFSQQNAERTDFPTGAFDLVSALLLVHELPRLPVQNVVAEAYRLLAPGGWFVIADGTPNRCLDALGRFKADWATENNGEPYLRDANARDYPAMLRAAGFINVGDTSDDRPISSYVFPFITRGQKP